MLHIKTCYNKRLFLRSGFSLLEVLIALSIIGLLVTTVLYTINHHLSIIDRHKIITIATMLAREKNLQCVKKGSNCTGSSEASKKYFDKPFEDYSYTVSTHSSPVSQISILEVRVSKGKEEVLFKSMVNSQW